MVVLNLASICITSYLVFVPYIQYHSNISFLQYGLPIYSKPISNESLLKNVEIYVASNIPSGTLTVKLLSKTML
jgi:hypothetical protein